MWCCKTHLLTSPVSLILARQTCLVFLALLLPLVCSKEWPSYRFIADSYLYYLLRFHLKLIILSLPVYEDTVRLAFCEYSPVLHIFVNHFSILEWSFEASCELLSPSSINELNKSFGMCLLYVCMKHDFIF